MEMTLSRLGITNVKSVLGGFIMPIGILVLVAMMVLPLAGLSAGYVFRNEYFIVFADPHGGDAYAQAT